MHSGRISQWYIKITRNAFIAKTSRSCNGPAVRIYLNKPNERGKIWLKLKQNKKNIQQRKKQLSRESNQDHLRQAAKDNVKWENYYI